MSQSPLQDITDYAFFHQFELALWERSVVLSNSGNSWPPPQAIWSTGTVDSVTDNGNGTLTFSMAAGGEWETDPDSTCSSPRWVNYTCTDGELCYLPSSYELVIEGDHTDAFTVVRGTIIAMTYAAGGSGSTGSGTLTLSDVNFKNAVTANFISDLSYLEGKNWFIIKAGGVWSSERLITKPNEPEDWKGTIDVGVIDGHTPETGMLFEYQNIYNPDPYNNPNNPLINWTANQWAGGGSGSLANVTYECMCYTSDGYLHRLSIIENDDHTLYFGANGSFSYSDHWLGSASESSNSSNSSGSDDYSGSSGSISPLTLVGNYSIIRAGQKCDPNRQAGYPFVFYSGYGEGFITLDENQGLTSTTLPVYSADWQEGDISVKCESLPHTCPQSPDCDYQIGLDDNCECVRAGDFLAPKFYASLRAWELTIFNLGPSYVSIDWDGTSNPIPYLFPARLCNEANVNAWTSGGTYVDGSTLTISVSIIPPYYPYPCWYYVEGTDSNGVVTTANGGGSITDDHTLSGGGFNSNWVTINVWITYGYSLWIERTFQYLYDKIIFIPDCDIDLGCIDPPEVYDYTDDGCLGIGMYVYRTNSSVYSEYGNGHVGSNGINFVPGELARYDGDSKNDPFSGTGAHQSSAPSDVYWSHFYCGKLSKPAQQVHIAKLRGIVTNSNLFSLTDSEQHWWTDWKGSGVRRTESGNATGGSDTILIDNTKTTGADACFWQLSRYNGAAFSWQGFYLEVHVDGSGSMSASSSGSNTIYKVPITGCDPSTCTLNFDPVPGLEVSSGTYYEIKEPGSYEPNCFQGRWLAVPSTAIGSGSGAQTLIEIIGNDDDTLFFAPQSEPIPVGTAYEIVEFGTGTTWEWSLTPPSDDRNYVKVNLPVGSGSVGSGGSVGYWIQPVGEDDRHFISGSGSNEGPFKFKKDQTANQPTIVKRYGLLEKGSFITIDTYNEMWALLNRLRWVALNGSWVDNTLPNTRSGSFPASSAFPFECYCGEQDAYAGVQTVLITGGPVYGAAGACSSWEIYTGYYFNDPVYHVDPLTGVADGSLSTTTITTGGPPYLYLDFDPVWWWSGCVPSCGYAPQIWYKENCGLNGVGAHMNKLQVNVNPNVGLTPSVSFYDFGATSTGALYETETSYSLPSPPGRRGDKFFNGGQPVNLNQWTAWSTVTGTGEVTSDELGTMTPPPFPAYPPLPAYDYPCTFNNCAGGDYGCGGAVSEDTYTYGFSIVNQFAIADYSDAFTYITL